MPKQLGAKRERIIEAVRLGLEGDAAVEFIRQSGYAMSSAGVAKHLRGMGGRGKIAELIGQGVSNLEILRECYPAEAGERPPVPPDQPELFAEDEFGAQHGTLPIPGAPEFESIKLTVKLPTDLYEAIRLAAHGERKTINHFVTEILTHSLGQLPSRASD